MNNFITLSFFLIISASLSYQIPLGNDKDAICAVAKIFSADGTVQMGEVFFKETVDPVRIPFLSDLLAPKNVVVYGNITNLTPGDHGMHIHEFGDVGNACMDAGAHFNPFNAPHGAQTSSYLMRHVGDLGNQMADANGNALFAFRDYVISLEHEEKTKDRNIIGRALVIHANMDDLGRANYEPQYPELNAESKKTGNSGKRIACGVIGMADVTRCAGMENNDIFKLID